MSAESPLRGYLQRPCSPRFSMHHLPFGDEERYLRAMAVDAAEEARDAGLDEEATELDRIVAAIDDLVDAMRVYRARPCGHE